MDRWYDSAEKGVFDYSIYGDKYYFATDLWPCFVLYSRKYILSIKKNIEIFNAIFNSESIIDLGCGIGYSTAMLKQLFPEKEIIGTNIKDTEQYGFCVEMGEVYNFKVIESEYNITKRIDVVFASEYFEHIFDAPNNIEKLINHLKPKYLLLANTFGQKSVGHFNYYKLNDCYGSAPQLAESIKVSRIFNNVLKKAGYTQIKTGLWNNRPNFWCQNEAV
jgi:trans-aconitate methyltransferase